MTGEDRKLLETIVEQNRQLQVRLESLEARPMELSPLDPLRVRQDDTRLLEILRTQGLKAHKVAFRKVMAERRKEMGI